MADLNIADVIANHRRGSHVVILQIPFEFNGKKIEAVEVGPFTLDHRMMWRDGVYKTPFDLMCSVCNDPISHQMMDPVALRQLRNPDDERLEITFTAMLPTEMRNSVMDKQWPGSLSPVSDRRVQQQEDDDRPLDDYPDDEPAQEDRGLDIG